MQKPKNVSLFKLWSKFRNFESRMNCIVVIGQSNCDTRRNQRAHILEPSIQAIWLVVWFLFAASSFLEGKSWNFKPKKPVPSPCEVSLAIMLTNRLPARAHLNLQTRSTNMQSKSTFVWLSQMVVLSTPRRIYAKLTRCLGWNDTVRITNRFLVRFSLAWLQTHSESRLNLLPRPASEPSQFAKRLVEFAIFQNGWKQRMLEECSGCIAI